MLSKHCLVCGKPYTQKSEVQKYCSKRCRVLNELELAKVRRIRNKKEIRKKCLNCGNEFIAPDKHSFTKFCSQKCRSRFYRVNNRDKILLLKRKNSKKDSYITWKRKYDKEYNDKIRFGGLRRSVMERDNFSCQDCGGEYPYVKIVVHHIDFNPKNNTMDNLIVLCRACHARKHSTL